MELDPKNFESLMSSDYLEKEEFDGSDLIGLAARVAYYYPQYDFIDVYDNMPLKRQLILYRVAKAEEAEGYLIMNGLHNYPNSKKTASSYRSLLKELRSRTKI